MKKFFDQLEENFMLILVAIITFFTLFAWVLKLIKVGNSSGMDVLANYAYAWFTMIAFAYSAKKGIFTKLDVITARYSKKLQTILGKTMNIITFLACFLMFILGIQALYSAVLSGELNEKISIPVAIVYVAPVLGFGFAIMRYVQNALTKRSGG